jgi:hypothetical protein
MIFSPQELIYKLETAVGRRAFNFGLVALAVLMLVVGYNWRAYRNLAAPEAMDAAQVARNLAEGRGYTTWFIRPFGMYLLQQHNQLQPGALEPARLADPAQLKGTHPDLANPPVYPVMLAGLMKVFRFHYVLPDKPLPFWSNGAAFWRYQPDFLIALFNQFLFLMVVVVVYFLARRLFDRAVAALSAVLLLGSELFWRFTVSGLSTMLLLLIFLGLVWCLLLLAEEKEEPRRSPAGLLALAGLLGGLAGLGALTRYSFGWLILPVLIFILICAPSRRWALGLAALAVFALVMAPWVARNYSVCGAPFGTATYALYENTSLFPEFRLQRSLEPDFSRSILVLFWHKLVLNSRQIIQSDFPRLGGSWLGAFFLAGLMVQFQKPAVQRLRYFLLGCLLVLGVVQVLGRTQLAETTPDINSENLLVLAAPLVMIYGVRLFCLLLEQIPLPFLSWRYAIIGGFGVIVSLPLLLALLPPRTIPVAYPPYYPPAIQAAARFAQPGELIMSDIPWAMAWYGQRQSVWLTLRAGPNLMDLRPTPDSKAPIAHEDFFAIHDYQKPVQALFLTSVTLDKLNSRELSPWYRTGEQNWGSLVFQSLPSLPRSATNYPVNLNLAVYHAEPEEGLVVVGIKNRPQTSFPLRYLQPGWPGQFLLTSRPNPLPGAP